MHKFRYVIVGGGVAGGYAAKQLAECGLEPGETLLVTEDGHLPYDRPPLSKGFLQGSKNDEDCLIAEESFYRKHDISYRLKTRCTGIDPGHRTIELDDGETVGYRKLLLATGSRLRTFDLPGADEADVLYLRTLDDAHRIREKARTCEACVVIGAGFIGMEVAASLTEHCANIDLVYPEQRLLPRLTTEEMAGFFAKYYEERNVRLHPGEEIERFGGPGGQAEVVLKSGKTLAADLIVAGIGVVPNTELVEGSSIQTERGILVNSLLQTSEEHVYAAGDIAEYECRPLGKRLRVEHWQNACDQGAVAARNMAGGNEEFTAVPYFFSDMFDLSWEFWGDTEGAEETLHVGDVENGSFSAWWVADGRVTATFVLNRVDEERTRAKQSVENHEELPQDIMMRGAK